MAVIERGEVFSWAGTVTGSAATEAPTANCFCREVWKCLCREAWKRRQGGHSLTLAKDGTVFSWGSSSMGQLGLVRSGGGEPSPQRADALSGFNVCSVAAGERRS